MKLRCVTAERLNENKRFVWIMHKLDKNYPCTMYDCSTPRFFYPPFIWLDNFNFNSVDIRLFLYIRSQH